jgi:diguanylate cyclase (GGDEF)-like protein
VTRAASPLFVLMILHALLGVFCLAIGRGERAWPGLRFWGIGLLVHAGGVLLALVFALPIAAGTLLGNMLIAAAPVFYMVAAFTTSRVRVDQRLLIAAGLASVAPVLIASFVPNRWLGAGALAPTPVAVALFAAGAWTLWRNPPPVGTMGAKVVTYAFVLAAGAWTYLIVMVGPPADAASGSGPGELAAMLGAAAQLVTAVVGTVGLIWLEIRALESRLDRFANADPLTGLPNARAAQLTFKDEAARAARHERSLAVVLLDIDRFKQLREIRGPLACEASIRHVANTLRGAIRTEDRLSRLTGETFVLLLPEQTDEGAEVTAHRLMSIVAAAPCKYDAWPMSITLSSGIAVCPADGREWKQLLSVAGRRLHAARATAESRELRTRAANP